MKLYCRMLWLALFVLVPFTAIHADEVDRILEQIAERLAEVNTLDQRAVVKTEMILHGIEHDYEQNVRLAFYRPDRLMVDMEHVKLVSDAEHVFLINAQQDRYMQWAIVDSLETTLKENDIFLYMQLWATTKALISTDPMAHLNTLKTVGLKILPDEEIDGARCWVLQYEQYPWMGEKDVGGTMWIDQSHGLLRKSVIRAGDKSEGQDDPHQFVGMTFEIKQHSVNKPLDDALFSFTPGTDAKEVAMIMELWVSDDDSEEVAWTPSTGLTRFPLSGKPAPDFELELLDGTTFRLSDYRGRIVVIDFWATWCGPCVRALPEIRALHANYRDQDVVVIGISRDRAGHEDRVRAMAEEKELEYPIGMDVDDIATDYLVRGIPCVVVIDGEGIVQGRKVGFSTAGMQALRKDLNRLQAGEMLETAEPMTEKEIEQMRAQRTQRHPMMRTTMDEKHFKVVWQSDVGAQEQMTHMGTRLQVRIPPQHFALRKGGHVTVIRAEDGESLFEMALPTEARTANVMQERPTYLYVSHADDGVVVALQQFYGQRETGRDTTSYYMTNVTMRAYGADGEERWTRKFGKEHYIQALDTLPVSDDEEVLLLAFWNQFILINTQGEELLSQPLSFNDRINIVQDPADGRILFYLTGSQNACYELVLPEP